MQIQKKTIVITGGGQGIGLAMALCLANQGANIAIIDVNKNHFESAIKNILEGTDASIKVKAYYADVSDELSVEAVFKKIKGDFGCIDGLINNAGITRDGLFIKVKDGVVVDKMTLNDFAAVIDVNLTGVFLCSREAAVHMIESKTKGVIINLSSITRKGNIGQTNYSAAKAGVVSMTTTWAKELGVHGIRVAAIAPGIIDTEMTRSMKPEIKHKLASMIPIGRMGSVGEIAEAAKFIFENDFFNGRVIEVDGGLHI